MRHERPWEALQELIDQDASVNLKSFLDEIDTDDLVSAVNHINADDRAKLLSLLSPQDAAEVVEDIPWVQALRTIEDLEAKHAAAIISEMSSDDQADFLHEMDDADAEAIMVEMDDLEAENIRHLIQYDSDTAGGLMITEFLAYEDTKTIENVVRDLGDNSEKYKKYNLQYIYVTHNNQFAGVLNMRHLLLSKPTTLLSRIALGDALTVDEYNTLDDLVRFFNEHDFYGVPVVDQNNELKGVVLREDLRETQTEKIHTEHLETQGIVGGEELRTMPILLRAKRRLSWLSVNILLNIAAASVIAFYQETLTAVIALAVFLPIISDMSGCSGNQAVAVSLRELSLGVVRPYEMLRVWIQEVSVGLLNGIVLGTLIGAAAWLWQGNIILGLVVGGALAINTVVAVSIGGTIPLFLKRMKVDPALASGPILTTVTDMFGFFLALTFATMMLKYS
jgi:magnesium transporter